MRRWAPPMLLALAITLAGCLLSPDEVDRSGLTLKVVAREADLAKSPCGDPVALLNSPTEQLRAVATVYRGEPQPRAPLGDVIATANLAIGPYDANDASREMTGALDVPLGPPGKKWTIVVALYYDGPVGRDPLGSYTGTIRLGSGLRLDAGMLIDQSLGGGEYRGSVGVTFGELTGGAAIDLITFDATDNLMEFGYETVIDWNGDPNDPRDVELRFAGSYQPALIFQAQQELPELVPGPVAVQLPTIVLTPLSPAPLALDLRGEVKLRFTDGSGPSEEGAVELSRLFTGCN